MNPKKIFTVLMFAMFTATVMPVFAGEPNPVDVAKKTNTDPSEQALTRLAEIRNMDKSNLTSLEKKELRKELRELKKESKSKKKSGIYLSIGAIIVIGVLLILLLG
ncbi:MAG: hypothetical protein M3Z92_13810 [Bacteroidota bacterium]|nr:hypothetical protein [Bacteroidota bacterium]MDQ6890858.1 hypothetical protein [Bacteroidota bacterium]